MVSFSSSESIGPDASSSSGRGALASKAASRRLLVLAVRRLESKEDDQMLRG
jgi:hypothetical protein